MRERDRQTTEGKERRKRWGNGKGRLADVGCTAVVGRSPTTGPVFLLTAAMHAGEESAG
jgi:hypothetical protein